MFSRAPSTDRILTFFQTFSSVADNMVLYSYFVFRPRKMSDSDNDNLLYAASGQEDSISDKVLIINGAKDGEPSENRRLKKTLALCGAFFGLVS